MSNITSCDSGSFSTENINTTGVYAVVVKQQPPEILGHLHSPNSHTSTTTTTNNSNGSNTNSQPPIKKKRSLPGNPDPSAEVIALSPNTLVTTNRFICEVCNKGFQRDQNLQLHRRGHNLPWKLKQRSSTEVVRKRVYVCPEPSCVHHNPGRALGDLTGIKKHFSRKHGEKKWKCDKCSKKYAVQSDWKAHSKICGTREYKCDCGTIFSRRDSFITHRAFCDALAEENINKLNEGGGQTQLSKNIMGNSNMLQGQPNILNPAVTSLPQMIATPEFNKQYPLSSASQFPHGDHLMTAMPAATAKPFHSSIFSISPSLQLSSSNNMLLLEAENGVHLAGAAGSSSPHMSATALLQKAAQMSATMSSGVRETEAAGGFVTTTSMAPPSFSTELQQQPYEMIMNRYMQQHAAAAGTQQDISLSTQYNNFNNANGITMDGVGMSGLDMFNAILDQSKALSKIIEQNNINIIRSSSSSADCVLNNIGRSVSSSNNISKGSEDDHGDGDVMTLDLLGIGGGGCSAHGNFYGGGGQHSETAARDHDFGAGFQSFSATSSI